MFQTILIFEWKKSSIRSGEHLFVWNNLQKFTSTHKHIYYFIFYCKYVYWYKSSESQSQFNICYLQCTISFHLYTIILDIQITLKVHFQYKIAKSESNISVVLFWQLWIERKKFSSPAMSRHSICQVQKLKSNFKINKIIYFLLNRWEKRKIKIW